MQHQIEKSAVSPSESISAAYPPPPGGPPPPAYDQINAATENSPVAAQIPPSYINFKTVPQSVVL